MTGELTVGDAERRLFGDARECGPVPRVIRVICSRQMRHWDGCAVARTNVQGAQSLRGARS